MSKKQKQNRIRVAIVGAGIGGASCAYFLKQLFENEIEIDIYEKCDVIGGRLATLEYNGREYETGGSIIHPSNLYMDKLRKICGLGKIKQSKCKKMFFGIYDKAGLVFKIKPSYFPFIDTLKVLRHFGMFHLFKLQYWISRFIEKFSKIYKLQNDGFIFTNIKEFLSKMEPNFLVMSEKSIKTILKEEKFNDKIIELSSVATLVNYCQPTSIHGFVGIVSLAGSQDGLWCVNGGNRLVAEKLIKLSQASLQLNTSVKSVENLASDSNKVIYEKDGMIHTKEYDYVVIAFPLTKFTNVTQMFPGFQCENYLNYELQMNYTYFIEGNIHLYPQVPLNRRIELLSCDNDVSFRSVTKLLPCDYSDKNDIKMWTDDCKKFYKVFSKDVLDDQSLTKIFGNDYKIVKKIDWFAYPNYVKLDGDAKQIEFPNIFIDSHERSRVLYINAIEWAASCMEVSCIGARNIANIIASKEKKEKKRKLNDHFKIKKTSKKRFFFKQFRVTFIFLAISVLSIAILFQRILSTILN